MLRRAGRARDADHRRAGPGFRRRRDDAGARRGQKDRNRHDLSRPNPRNGHPRNPRDRARALKVATAAPAALARCRLRAIIGFIMPTTREVLQATIALEKRSMALYARFAKTFAAHPRLHEFWFGMARD